MQNDRISIYMSHIHHFPFDSDCTMKDRCIRDVTFIVVCLLLYMNVFLGTNTHKQAVTLIS